MPGNSIATWGRRAGLSAAGLLFGALLAEAAVRMFPPQSPVNVIRSGSDRWGDIRLRNGTIIWGLPAREGRACVAAHPERQRIAVFGDSIPYGVGIEDNEAYTTLLEARLNEAAPSPGFCVMNFAQPAFGFEQTWAIAQDELPAVHPTLVVWHFWNEQREYQVLGDAAYNLQDFQLRPDGFPAPRGGDWVSDGVNRALFLHSAIYRHLALSRPKRRPLPSPQEITAHWRDAQLRRVPGLAQLVGAPLIFVLSTFLDRPFPELQKDRRHEDMEAALVQVAGEHGIPFYRLQDLLVASDYKTVRMDECCHLNAAGHAAMAEALAPLILKRLHPDAPPSVRSDQ